MLSFQLFVNYLPKGKRQDIDLALCVCVCGGEGDICLLVAPSGSYTRLIYKVIALFCLFFVISQVIFDFFKGYKRNQYNVHITAIKMSRPLTSYVNLNHRIVYS